MQDQNSRLVRSRARTHLSLASGMSSRISELFRDANPSAPDVNNINTTESRRTASSGVAQAIMADAISTSPLTRRTLAAASIRPITAPATNRSATDSSTHGPIRTRITRSSFTSTVRAAPSTTAARIPVSSSVGRTSAATGSREQSVRRRGARAAAALPTVQEHSSVATARRQTGEGATGCRGRSSRNVHVDKEVQTENRSDSDEVSVSYNAIRRRHQSLSPTNLPCAICFNEMHPKGGRTIISVKCGHVFCNDCIETNYERRKLCPLCLEPIQRRHFRKIYL